ncbi:MAG: hypothetical protein M1840_002349 [Geoglossum simile]|nr:MAG: hypothetical protein M1840_002349 [Geoglossum simile]
MSHSFIAFLAAVLCCPTFVWGIDLHNPNASVVLLPSYDYIIVGGGISGLVVANRLSEDLDRSILVLEAGNPDNYEEFIQVPQFVGSDIGSQYDWNLSTVPQMFLDNVTRPMPQGKALGGGSILNAMCWNRGGANDYNAWEAFGNPGWGWNGLLPYFIKSENYTPVFSKVIAQEFSINHNPSKHGHDGPVHVSYPKFFYDQTRNFFRALNFLGVPTALDPGDGISGRACFIPTGLHPENQTRSDARRAYYDPYLSRPNLHVVTGQHVTRVLMDRATGSGNTLPLSRGLRAIGVEFSANETASRKTARANIEVIVAAGALHSVQLLQLSGIGPKLLLDKYDIPVAIDLPGVGNNLQDHYLVGTFYPYNNVSVSPADLIRNATYNSAARTEYYTNKTGPWTAGSPNGVAFPSLSSITNISTDILHSAFNQSADQYLVANLDKTIVAGFSDQKSALVGLLSSDSVGAYEIINNNIGSLTVSIMHPFSRGTVEIGSSDPFRDPIIDPRYGSNPIDLLILVEALKFNRKILSTPPMVELQPAQFVPPINADDSSLMEVIKNGIRTEFHPSGTCAMLPLEKGGVVDSHLVVWGTQNLRVVDAGIFPLVPAAHLQATVYAVAEKAADIIKADYVAALAELRNCLAPTGIPKAIISNLVQSLNPITMATASSPADASASETPVVVVIVAGAVPARVPAPVPSGSESHTAVGSLVHGILELLGIGRRSGGMA